MKASLSPPEAVGGPEDVFCDVDEGHYRQRSSFIKGGTAAHYPQGAATLGKARQKIRVNDFYA
jgi:hypothetical protein